jgi:hypothetical protein
VDAAQKESMRVFPTCEKKRQAQRIANNTVYTNRKNIGLVLKKGIGGGNTVLRNGPQTPYIEKKVG